MLTGARLLHRQLGALRKVAEGVRGDEERLLGIELGDPCEEDLLVLTVTLVGPEGSPYDGGRFLARLTFTDDYPHRPPKGVFLTTIFHPNVSPTTGEICVSTLQKDWQPALGLRHLLLTLRSLLLNPNAESALNEAAGRILLEDYGAFCARAALMARIHAHAPAAASPGAENVLAAGGLSNDMLGGVASKPAAGDHVCAPESPTGAPAKRIRRL